MQMCRTPAGTLAINHAVASTYMFHCRNNLAARVYKCAARYHSSVMSTPQIPSDWALSITHTASEFVASQCFANIHNLPPVPTPPIDLITYMACCQLSRVLSQAYLNPSQYPKFSPRYLLIDAYHLVRLDVDLIRYNEALDKHQSGLNEKLEQTLFEKFPPSFATIVDVPCVFIDAGGRVLLWYLPGAINNMIRVGFCLVVIAI
jgi:hypothetical protein